jgi:hypothetical protein
VHVVDTRNEEVNILDTTGIRVNLYLSFLDSAEEFISLWQYLSILEALSWLSDNFKTNLRQKTINSLHTLCSRGGLLATARLFQRNVVDLWRGRKPKAEVLPLPSISVEDETTPKGNGKIVLELAYLPGFLSRDNTSWVVPENVCNRYLFLVGDALSIVRCLSFQRDLLPREGRSFCTCYKEKQVIRKALKQMVIIPGDLHGGGFHMLGPQYTLFYPAFLQPIQVALGWKRIKGKDVSICFQQASMLADMTLVECERVLYHLVLHKCPEDQLALLMTRPSELAVYLAKEFQKTLRESTGNMLLRFIVNFVIIGRRVRHFKKAVKCCDAISIEAAYIRYLPI